jgi:hypothetical protein
LGPIAQPLEAEMAAILSIGPESAISHDYAVGLHKLHPYPAKDGFVDVTVLGRQPGPKPGIRIHRTKHLAADEVMRLHRIPVTGIARTIIDLAPALGDAALEQLLATAHRQRPAHTQALHTLIARYPGRPGVPAVRKLLAAKATVQPLQARAPSPGGASPGRLRPGHKHNGRGLRSRPLIA